MALFTFLGEHRKSFTTPSGEGPVKVLRQLNPVEALLNDSFTEPSTLQAKFLLPKDWMPTMYPGLNPTATEYPDRRAYWINFRTKDNKTRTFAMTDFTEDPTEKNGLSEVTINAYDPRGFIDDFPGVFGTNSVELTGDVLALLVKLTERMSNKTARDVAGKDDRYLLPIYAFDPTWQPSDDQIAQGFVNASVEIPSFTYTISNPGPQSAREAYTQLMDKLEANMNMRYELWPLEISGEDGTNSPWFRWVLRKRIQTSLVLSEFSGTYSLENIQGNLIAGDQQNYRSDNNTRVAYSSGSAKSLTKWTGPWARQTFVEQQVSNDAGSSKTFVPTPAIPKRLAFSGKGGVNYLLTPGSFGYVRNGTKITPVYFNTVSSYYGSDDWSLGSVYSEMISYDVAAESEPVASSIIFKVSGSRTYSIPFQQAPLPTGGATYSIYDGEVLLARQQFTQNPTSSSFNNVITVDVGDLAEHTLRIAVDGSDAFGRHTFGKANVWDGSLHSATNSVFNYLTEIIQLPLDGYLRRNSDATNGVYHTFYTYRQFESCLKLTKVPTTESWNGMNESLTITQLWGFMPLSGSGDGRQHRGAFENQFFGCTALTTWAVEAHWPIIQRLATGYRNQQYSGCTNANLTQYLRFADHDSVKNFIIPTSASTIGYRRSMFANVGLVGAQSFGTNFDSLSTVPDYFLEMTFTGCTKLTSLGFNLNFGTSTVGGHYLLSQVAVGCTGITTFAVNFATFVSQYSGNYFLYRGLYNLTKVASLTLNGFSNVNSISGIGFCYGVQERSSFSGGSFLDVVFPVMNNLTTTGVDFFRRAYFNVGEVRSWAWPEFLSLKTVGSGFFYSASYVTRSGVDTMDSLRDMSFPAWNAITTIADNFLREFSPGSHTTLKLPTMTSLTTIGNDFMNSAFGSGPQYTQSTINIPAWNAVTTIGDSFLSLAFGARSQSTVPASSVSFPTMTSLLTVGNMFMLRTLSSRTGISVLSFPAWDTLTTAGVQFMNMYLNSGAYLSLPNMKALTQVGDYFMAQMFSSASFLDLTFPGWNSLTTIGTDFMSNSFKIFSLKNLTFPSGFLNGLKTVIPSGFFVQTFVGSSVVSVSVPGWDFVTSVGLNFFAQTFQNCKSLKTVITPSIAGVKTIGNSFMYGCFSGCTAMVTPPSEQPFTNVTSVGNDFMTAFFKGCTALETLPLQNLSGKSVSYTNYRSEYARGCTGIVIAQAVWDKPTFTSSPASASANTCRQNGGGGSSAMSHNWRDGSGMIVAPTAGTNALGIPANFYVA